MKKKYSLRPLTEHDAESLARQLNNKKVWDNLRDALPYPYTPQDAAWFIDFQQNNPLLTCYAIVVDNQVVGNIGFTRSQDIERFTAEVGYYIGEDYWGQGIMSVALSEAVTGYFKTTDVVRLFATPFDHNKASAKVLERAGFTLKCTLSKGAYKNGQFVDMLYYERIKTKIMETIYCQSCGMPMQTADQFGTNADGSANQEYCCYCYKEGAFVQDCTMDEMIDHCVKYLGEFNGACSTQYTKEEAITEMKKHFPKLKRWVK